MVNILKHPVLFSLCHEIFLLDRGGWGLSGGTKISVLYGATPPYFLFQLLLKGINKIIKELISSAVFRTLLRTNWLQMLYHFQDTVAKKIILSTASPRGNTNKLAEVLPSLASVLCTNRNSITFAS